MRVCMERCNKKEVNVPFVDRQIEKLRSGLDRAESFIIENDPAAIALGALLIPTIGALASLLILETIRNSESKQIELTPTPVERSIGDFETSFNSDLQLTPIPRP